MTAGALVAYQIGHSWTDDITGATMLLTTLSVFHVAAALLSRDQVNTIFDRDAIPGSVQLRRYGIAVLAIIAVTGIGFLQRIFSTTSLSFGQWCTCLGLAASLVVVEEVLKWVLRHRVGGSPTVATPALAPALPST
jgi:P-type Ca2+ transporter type 2C